ncbi:MAG: hypothetical protein ACNI3C_06055 [Candidatus Marinarcus sp.]|uniref:hypothetical protein n=1 Tax=Candidatus Marinarcus sp. TaxID=3100987 RepID=UPI003B00C796
MSKIEVRKIPKIQIVAIVVIIIVGFAYYIFSTQMRDDKLQEVLATLGYQNTEDVVVFQTHKVENEEVRRKETLYTLKFKDLQTNKECKGFVLYNYKHEYSKDIECK